ncbi:MAG: dihydrofolate reductase family protein, partial [Longispora sp.]|nr:dihydrofolate reductase family protein [Longispora sp. (in: high G+C Gram-positive bacteria)]
VGGAATVQQCINAGLVDEIRIHLVPILLGGGIRLFENISVSSVELEKTRAIDSTGATHFSFRIVK